MNAICTPASRHSYHVSCVVIAVLATAALAEAADAATFLGKRRTETAQGGMPNPFYWSDLFVPIVNGTRTLNITYNTNKDVAFPATHVAALQSAVGAWARNAVQADAAPGNIMPMPGGSPTITRNAKMYDAESTFIHELGHAFGLDHPNLGERVPAPQRFYANSDDFDGANPRAFITMPGADNVIGTRDDGRGGNRSLFISDEDNNPFNTPPNKIDRTTFKLDRMDKMYPNISTSIVAAAPKAATGFDPIANLSSLMATHRQAAGDSSRKTTWDDWAGLRYLEAGRDQTATTADDYIFAFTFNNQGVNAPNNLLPAGTNILVSTNANIDVTNIAQSIPQRVGQNNIVGNIIEFTLSKDEELLGVTVAWLDGDELSPGTSIVFADVIVPLPIPEPASALIVALAVVGGEVARRRTTFSR